MPDFGAPIANTDPNSGLKTIAGLMSLQQQQQAIQSGGLTIQKQQAELPAAQAQAQLTQDKIGQQQAFAKQFATGKDELGNSLNLADGTPDAAKIIAMQGRLAPLMPEIGKSVMDTISAKVGLQSASQILDARQRAEAAGPIQAIATNPSDPSMVGNASTALDQWATAHPEMQGVVNNAKTLLGHIGTAQDPAQRAHMANSMAALMQGGQTVETGASTPPSGQQTMGADILGRPVTFNKDQTGALSVGAPPGASYKPLMAYPAGEGPNTLSEVQGIRTQTQTAANAAPQQHFLNKQIIQTAPEAFTGSNASGLTKFFSLFGGKYDPSNSASASAQLQHFISQATINNAPAAGANTDAAKATVASAVLPTDAPEKAIPIIARINDAFATASEMKNKGMSAAIQSSPNDIFESRRYQNDWQANADPNVFRLINAGNNPALLKEVRDSLGATEADRTENLKALLPKYRAIKSLTTTGTLPQ